MPEFYAHSTSDTSRTDGERLVTRLHCVAASGAAFAAPFGFSAVAAAAGLLHDIGKFSSEFQTYIASPRRPSVAGPDHSTAGAIEAERHFGPELGRIIAYAVAGHHAGLANFQDLERRLTKPGLPDHRAWQPHASDLPNGAALAPSRRMWPNPCPGFSRAFLTRRLFSCLVDACPREAASRTLG